MNLSITPSYRFLNAFSVRFTTAAIILLALSACSSWLPDAHKLDITQGNVIQPEQLAELSPGQPKAVVRRLLGEPVLQDPFHDQRWDYILRHLPGDEAVEQSRLTLYFENDILTRIDDSLYRDPDSMLPPPVEED